MNGPQVRFLPSHRWLLGVLILGLVVRVGWGLWQPADRAALERLPDQVEYVQLADHLLRDGTLRFYDDRFGDQVYAYRMPGYPLFLAAVGGSVRAARVAQALVDISTVLGVYVLARRWLERGPSVAAAGIVALNPFYVYFSGLLLSETLYAAMLVWGMVLLAGRRAQGQMGLSATRFLLGALMLALAVHVRPSGLGLPLVLGVAAVVMNRLEALAYDPQASVRWRVPVISSLALITVLVLLPWAVRNYRQLGAWVWTTTNSGITLYDGFHDGATGASDQLFVEQMPQLKRMTEVQRSQYLRDLARQWIAQHPREALRLAAAKVGRTWSPVPLSSEYGGRRLYVAAGLAYGVPLFVLVVLGVTMGNLPRSAKAFLLLPAIYLTAVHALSVGSLRYRMPADAPMAVIAAGVLARRPATWQRVEGLER